MKTRRIHLEPGECAEIVNPYGTSMLKVVARFHGTLPCAVIYEQPDVLTFTPDDAKEHNVRFEPETIIDLGDFNPNP